MHVRTLCLSALAAALFAGAPAHAYVVTTGFANGHVVGANGVDRPGSTTVSRFAYVGGNATTSTNNTFPSFAVFEVNGASVLQQFRTALGNNTGTVTNINSLSLQLYDEGATVGSAGVAGGFDFSYATNAVTLSAFTPPEPTYDSTDTGGLTTQLGPVIGLGSGTYTPATTANAALPAYALGSTAGNAAILADINAGNTFRIVLDANTSATRATLGGYFGLGTFVSPASLTINADAVPEPASLGLAGVAAVGLLRRRVAR